MTWRAVLSAAIGAVLGTVTLPAVVVADTPASETAGPSLSVPSERLEKALICLPEEAGWGQGRPIWVSGRNPVLLVHGTATNAMESWYWNYLQILPNLGYDVCVVTLPDRALGDIQVSTEYVVHAIRHMAQATGYKVDIIGHSQGALEPRWALKYWPDLQDLVDDVISLAGPHHGASGADQLCIGGSCAPAVQQMRTGSRFLTTLNAGGETPGQNVSWTSIYSATDELVQPPASAALEGAANFLIQDLCPGRVVHHGGLLHDEVVMALVLDALERPGPATAPGPEVCTRDYPYGFRAAFGNADLYGNAFLALVRYEGSVDQEPPIAAYAAS